MGQQELADLCELSLDQISNIERGKNWTGEMSLALLADAFHVSHDALLDYTGNEEFLRNGGANWRASRKKRNLLISPRRGSTPVVQGVRKSRGEEKPSEQNNLSAEELRGKLLRLIEAADLDQLRKYYRLFLA